MEAAMMGPDATNQVLNSSTTVFVLTRKLLRATQIAMIVGLAGFAQAQIFPSKPLRVITGPPGAPMDLVPRLIQARLAEYLGQAIVIENKPGSAAGIISASEVARATPDGYTLLSVPDSLSVTHHLLKQIPYDGLKAFAPVTRMVSAPPVLAVSAGFAPRNLGEFIAYARANPAKVSLGSSGSGSRAHFAGVVLASEAGLNFTHVPFKGSGASALALVSGDLNAAFGQPVSLLSYARTGKIRMLAIASKSRFSQVPDIPPIADQIPGFDVFAWFGIVAPAMTPKDIIGRLHREITRALALPDIREKIVAMGLEVDTTTPEEFGAFMQAESEKFGKVIRQYNIRID
jgi:tripartite-type tricarboxylate transporter receptor subunit TctC